jgi:hypothetical protein
MAIGCAMTGMAVSYLLQHVGLRADVSTLTGLAAVGLVARADCQRGWRRYHEARAKACRERRLAKGEQT